MKKFEELLYMPKKPTNYKKKFWREEEDLLLTKAIEKHGQKWPLVAAEVGNLRDSKSCQARWRLLQARDRDPYDSDKQIARKKRKVLDLDSSDIEEMARNKQTQGNQYLPVHYQQLYEETTRCNNANNVSATILSSNQNNINNLQPPSKPRVTLINKNWNKQDEELLLQAYKIYMGDWQRIFLRFPEKQPKSIHSKFEELTKRQNILQSPLQEAIDVDGRGSEQFDISDSESSVIQQLPSMSEQEEEGETTPIQDCYLQIQKLLKTEGHRDAIYGIKEAITKLIIT